MEIFDFGFLKVRVLDIIDVLIVAFLLYKVYEQLKGGVAIRIFIGLIAIYALWGLCVRVLDMKLMGALLGQFIGVGVIALIIVFQQEVRSFLIMLGTNKIFNRSALLPKWIPWKSQYQESNNTNRYEPKSKQYAVYRNRPGSGFSIEKVCIECPGKET